MSCTSWNTLAFSKMADSLKSLKKMKVAELKRDLAFHGLRTDGYKKDLLARLKIFLQNQVHDGQKDPKIGNVVIDDSDTDTTSVLSVQDDPPEEVEFTTESLNREFSLIWQKIQSLSNPSCNENLLQENRFLKEEVSSLNIKLAKMEIELKQAEDEKNSLLKVTQILIKDSAFHEVIHSTEHEPLKVNVPRVAPSKPPDQANTKHSQNERPSNSRKTSAIKDRSTSDTAKKTKAYTDSNKKREVWIAGDSMVKHLQGHKMSKHANVKISTFPGCSIQDMGDHIKPILRKKPHLVIVHVGTNDLKSCTSERSCAEQIVQLATEAANSETEIAISGLITRSDDDILSKKVSQVNKVLRQYCNQNGWSFIDHSLITTEHLNRSGLHLNSKGTWQLAQNFTKYIRGD